MLRTLWVVFIAVCVTIPVSLAVIVIALVSSTSPLIDPLIRFWARSIVRAAGIRLTTENLDRIESDRRYILVANHTSYLDIPCIYAAIPQPIRFLAKISLFKIPIFGWALARAGFIPIDRKNRRTAVKSFDLAAARIRKGNTIMVFPEEGRSATREMRPFQRGGFLLAIKSEQPIVPLAIDGMFDVLPVGAARVRPGPVVVRVGTPITTADVTVREKERLAQESRAQILAMLA